MYQINDSFTRLEPAIDMAQAMQTQCANDPCVIGDPPTELLSVHTPALLNAWHAQLVASLANPTQVELRKGHRRVQILGSVIFEFEADGTVEAYQWQFDDRGYLELGQLPANTVVAVGVPYEALWMSSFQTATRYALSPFHPDESDVCHRYVAWANAQFITLCWTPMVQDAVRERIEMDLALVPELLEIASDIQITAQPMTAIRLAAYNHVVKFASKFRTVKKDNPLLIPLFALLVEDPQVVDCDPRIEVLAAVKMSLLNNGIEPAMWRLIAREGTPWLKECLAFHDFEGQTLAMCAMDLLTIAQAFGTSQSVPTWLLSAVLQLGGNPNAPRSNFAMKVDDLFPLCARLGVLVSRADTAMLQHIQEHALQIINWASDHLAKITPEQVRRASLDWLIRRYQQQDELERIQHEAAAPWKIAKQRYALNLDRSDISVVVLDSAKAVWEEGRLMRHCASQYVHPCARGELVMVSIRLKDQKRPLATAAFDIRPVERQRLRISGFANALVGDDLIALARQCQAQIRQQLARRGQKKRTRILPGKEDAETA